MTTQPDRILAHQPLSRLTKFLYGFGDLGFALSDTILAVLFAIFLTDVIGLSPGYAAAAVFIGKSWDYINDPLFGYISDRTRTRWGRRRPFLLFGFLPFAISFMLLWLRPPFDHPLALTAYYALAYLLYDAAATLVYMPYYALTPELTPDYDERTTLTSYRMAFSILGSLVGFTVPLMIIGKMHPDNYERVVLMAVIFGLVGGLPLLFTFFGTREREEYQHQAQPDLKTSLRAVLNNRPFKFAVGIFLFTWTGISIIETMLLYFLKYRMLLEEESELVAAAVFVTALVTLPFWEWTSRKLDKRMAYIFGMLFLSGVMIILAIVDPSWGFPAVIALATLAGVGVGAVHVLPWAMIPDAVEVDEVETGQRHEGMFYSLVLLLRKVSSSIAIPLTLLVLEWTGYNSSLPQQPDSAIRAIQFLTGPLPSIFLVAGIAFAFGYPLSREVHQSLRVKLASRHTGND